MPTQTYRVVTNNFLVGGGDSFTGFQKGVDRELIGNDAASLEAYIKAHSPIEPAIRGRITRAQ